MQKNPNSPNHSKKVVAISLESRDDAFCEPREWVLDFDGDVEAIESIVPHRSDAFLLAWVADSQLLLRIALTSIALRHCVYALLRFEQPLTYMDPSN